MSIEAADLRKLVKIVRQYEVIYGGGISTSDAAVREDCEDLIGIIEAELGSAKSSSGRSAQSVQSLPSLMDAPKVPREADAVRPKTARSAELATLSSGKGQAKSPSAIPEKGKTAAKSAPQSPAKTGSKKPVAAKPGPPARVTPTKAAPPAAGAKALPAKASPAKALPAKALPAKALPAKASTAKIPAAGKKGAASGKSPQAETKPEHVDEVYKDVRSRHLGAAKAAIERSDKIAGSADSSDESEAKKHFAALHLFDAFQQNRLPKYGGFIVCVRFSEDKGYAVIEIIGYENMQDLYPDGDTLVFKSVGCKLYALVEPSGYLLKSVEPVNRPSDHMIPYRFTELVRITTKRFQGILVGRKPVFMPSSFSVLKPSGEDLAVLFYNIADVYTNIQDFLIMILRDRLGAPVIDSRKAAEVIARGIREFRLWMDET